MSDGEFDWYPGAARVPSHRANPMSHNSPRRRGVFHRQEGEGMTAVELARYVITAGDEYHLTVDSHGNVAQLYPFTSGSRALKTGPLPAGNNRNGTRCVQLCATGYTARGWHSDAQREKCAEIAQWLAKHHGIPAHHAGDGTRNGHRYLHNDGWFAHAEVVGNDHTDRPPNWDWLGGGGADHQQHHVAGSHPHPDHPHHQPAPSDTDHYRVLVSHDGRTVPVLNADHGSWTIAPTEAKQYPHGRLHRDRVDEAIRWAGEQHHPLVRVERARAAVPHPDHAARAAHEGRLTLRDGAHWPTDHRTVERLKRVAHDLGVEVRIISGLRTRAEQERLWYGWTHRLPGFNLAARPGTSNHERGHAADTDVVKPDGSLVCIGSWPGARAALKKHGLVLSVGSECWHVDPVEVARWANPPIP